MDVSLQDLQGILQGEAAALDRKRLAVDLVDKLTAALQQLQLQPDVRIYGPGPTASIEIVVRLQPADDPDPDPDPEQAAREDDPPETVRYFPWNKAGDVEFWPPPSAASPPPDLPPAAPEADAQPEADAPAASQGHGSADRFANTWTDEDDKTLMLHALAKTPMRRVADIMGRTQRAVEQRLAKLRNRGTLADFVQDNARHLQAEPAPPAPETDPSPPSAAPESPEAADPESLVAAHVRALQPDSAAAGQFTPADDLTIAQGFADGLSLFDIAANLQRPPGAIRARWADLCPAAWRRDRPTIDALVAALAARADAAAPA